MGGRTMPSKIRLTTVEDIQPEIELQLDAPASIGQRVRISVFDEGLFRKGALARDYDRVFSVFIGSAPPVLPDVVRDPGSLIGDGSNGVLLTFESQITAEVPERAERRHKKCAFAAASNIRTCNPTRPLVDIAFGLRDANNEVAFGPLIRIPSSPAFRVRRIVVVVSDTGSNAIVYSNAWRTEKFVKQNLQAVPTLLDSKAAEAAIPALVGGGGQGTGSPAPAGEAAPTTDVTGMYEAFVSADQAIGTAMPVLMVQLNLAGNAIAGWWAPPPERVTGRPQHAITQGALAPPLARGEFGALLGHFRDPEWEILWAPSNVSVDPRPDLVGANKFAPNDRAGTGSLRIRAPERLELRLNRGTQSTTLFLSKAEPVPRWSNATVDLVFQHAAQDSSTIRRSLRGQQERPIPLAFWRLLQQDMPAGGALGALIVLHETTPTNDTQTRRGHREAISDYLEALVAIDEHEEAVVAHFSLFASNIQITINGQTKSTYDWLAKIAEDFVTLELSRLGDQEQALRSLPPGFRDTGLVPKQAFVYKLAFFALGFEIGAIIGGGGYYFEVEVSRKLLRDNAEVDPPPTDPWELLPGKKKKLFGGFLDVGISLGIRFKLGGSSNLVTEISFKSATNIPPGEFNQATFYTITATFLSLSVALISGSAASSAVMVLTVNTVSIDGSVTRSVRLVGGIDEGLSPPDPSKPDSQILTPNLGISVAIASLTLGKGWMTEDAPTPVSTPDQNTPPADSLGQAEFNVAAFFRRNSATLEGRSLSAFQEAIAVERAIFVSGGGRATAAGHASPEGPDNDGLTQRRAENVVQVLRQALGNALAVTPTAVGFGHRAALDDGLIRPEDIEPGDEPSRNVYRQQEATIFKQYRVVMLWVAGILLIDMRVGKGGLE